MALLAVVMFFAISTSLFGYLSVVILVLSHEKLRTKTNILFVAQSFAYILLQCTTLIAMFNLTSDIVTRTELGCVANNIVGPYSCANAHINVFLIIAVERWTAIFKPLHYVNYVTNLRIAMAVTLAFIIGIANGCLVLVWNSVKDHETKGKIPWEYIKDCRVRFYLLRGDYLLYFYLYMTIAAGIIAGLYFHILVLARRHTRQIQNLVVHLQPSTNNTNENGTSSGNPEGNPVQNSISAIPLNSAIYKKAKGTTILFALICFYIISKLPFRIYFLFQYDFMSKFTLYTFDYVSATAYISSIFCSYSFDLIQPFIYMFGQADIRKVIKEKFSRCCKSNRRNTAVG